MKDHVTITTDSGERVEAVAPVVVSASRSTDIPAFYARWFFHRLRRGYCVWINPFNRRRTYVSFARCRVVVFWTKNPKPILPYLHELDERGIHYYFQVTLNDYEAEGFEPGVPPLTERIATFRELAGRLGAARVVWRFDPLILSPTTPPPELLARIRRVGNALAHCTEKLVFSFVDVQAYRKVRQNLVRETRSFTADSVAQGEPDAAQRAVIAEGLARLRDAWAERGWAVELATCAEADDFSAYGIAHNCCVDAALMERLFGDDHALVYYLRTGHWPELDLFGACPPLPAERRNLKDKGQRRACGCMVSKDIGQYDTCRHFCVYCYANSSRDRVQANAARVDDESESLLG